MKYVTYMSAVFSFTEAGFKRQMKAVASGERFDYMAGKEIGTGFLDHNVNCPESAEEFVKTGREVVLM